MKTTSSNGKPDTAIDFGNILFAGPCNQRCPYCIGQHLPPSLNRSNLDEFPPRNLYRFAKLLGECSAPQVSFSGTNTDPQLYRHQAKLIDWLHQHIPGVQLSLHTNGQLAETKMEVFNAYDKATISLPSFELATFARMTGTSRMPRLERILAYAKIPIKLSTVITKHNATQIEDMLDHCIDLGIERVAFRQQYGTGPISTILDRLTPAAYYRNNPVYDYRGIQVTYWRFESTTSTALNLFADGTISSEYLLTAAARHRKKTPTCQDSDFAVYLAR